MDLFFVVVDSKLSDGSTIKVPITNLRIPATGIHETIVVQVDPFYEGQSHVVRRMELLNEIPLFRKFSASILFNLLNCIEEQRFQPNEEILSFGNKSETFFVVEYGTLVVLDSNRNYLTTLTRGDCFGENSLRSNDFTCSATIVSKYSNLFFQKSY